MDLVVARVAAERAGLATGGVQVFVRHCAVAEAVGVGDVRLPLAAVVASAGREYLRGSGWGSESGWVLGVGDLAVEHVADAQRHAIELRGLVMQDSIFDADAI